jgi:molybdenum cofactor cytidylyltransferase
LSDASLSLGVLVLAAGLSRRWGGANKLLQVWRGRPMAAHVIGLAEAIDTMQRAIVVHRDQVGVVALLDTTKGWRVVENEQPDLGLSSSLKLGLAALEGCDRVLVMLADMPDVSLATILALIATPITANTYAVVPSFEGQWGNPVVLGARAMLDCMTLEGDRGARGLLLAHKEDVIAINLNDSGILRDFDKPEDMVEG